jgi:hypothetical protein
MNIKHATSEEVRGDRLKAIFNRQRELMEKYHYIEAASGLCQTSDCPVNLDDKKGQARIKDFSWRITEELGEALDALLQDNNMEHYTEELIDGLHFLTELTILAGRDYDSIVTFPGNESDIDYLERIELKGQTFLDESLGVIVSRFIMKLGMMCNCLKNKPWKQTHMKTDQKAFYEKLEQVWIYYIAILSTALTTDEIVDIYLKKAQVNKFRQRSNY